MTIEDKKMSPQVHELKTNESRFGPSGREGREVSIGYYCVCGKWSGKVDHLHYGKVFDLFVEEHLNGLGG